MIRRLAAVAVTECRLLWRYRVVAAAIVATAIWLGLLRLAPAATRSVLLPFILFFDLTALGFFFVPAMTMVERAEGVLAVAAVSRLSPGEQALVRVSLVSLLALAASLVLLAGAGAAKASILTGVALSSVLGSLVALSLARGADSFPAFMTRVPAVAVPLLLPALVYLSGVSRSAVLYVSPLTCGAALLSGELAAGSVVWMLAWIVLLAAYARKGTDATPGASRRSEARSWGRIGAVRSFARADRRALLRDGLALMVLGGVPLTALAARAFEALGVPWIAARYGVDAVPYLPLVWAFLLVVHPAVMLGSIAGLLFLEERDAALLPALAVTRASLRGLLVYRLGAATVASAAATALGLAIAGARSGGGAAALVAASVASGPVAPVTALLMAAFAANRAQGIAALKMLALPLYLPAALWLADGAARHVLDVVPTAWPVHALWSASGSEAWMDALVGVALSGTIVVALARRFETRGA